MNRERLTNGLYALFGLAFLASAVVDLRSASGAQRLFTVGTALVCVALAVAGTVGALRPGTEVAGIELGIGEQPRWVLVLLVAGIVVLGAGTVLRL
ncbi:hypothetical protein [Haloplanus sp. C73]|uniref:hypothetical protein n=1 Tax=Haloplanus sp. C73 TaxID=3421641 RepID=UPI003EBEC65F